MFLVDINVCLEQLGAEDGDTMSDAYSLEEFEVCLLYTSPSPRD